MPGIRCLIHALRYLCQCTFFRSRHEALLRWRRQLAVALVIAVPALSAGAAGDWVVGQVTTLSGANGADLGQGLALGQRIYFEHVNASGGVHGRKLQLVTLDDRYVAQETVKLTQELLRTHKPIALMGYRGTANTLALVKSGILTEAGIPLIGTLTGAKELQTAPNVYHVRTSYPIEIGQLVTQVVRQGHSAIAVLYADDAFGQSGLQAAEEAVHAAGGRLVAKAGYDKAPEQVAPSIQKAVATIAAAQPNAVVMIAVGAPAYDFLQAYRARDPFLPLYSLSVVNPSEVTKIVGVSKAQGVGFSQVFPFPYSDTSPLAREYRALLKKYAPEAQPNYFSLEGYVNAKVLVAALRKSAPSVTRAELMHTLETMGELDLGGFWLQFSPTQHNGSRFTELTVIAKSGNLIR